MGTLRKYSAFLIIVSFALIFFQCGGKKNTTRKIEISITGLDGNGVAEKNISNALISQEGIKTISFNYLNNQIVVVYDTTQITEQKIITTITTLDMGRYKILDIKENKEKSAPLPPTPSPEEDIHDDTDDQFKDNA